MEIREMHVERRQGIGKGQAKRLRRSGVVPAILYGARTEPVPLALAPRELQRVLGAHTGGGVLVSLRFPDEQGETRTAIIRDLQYDPVRETLLHVDLQAVSMDEEITVEVSIHVVGEAAGVKEQSGILALIQRTVEVSCLPALIPERLDVDVSRLRIGDVLTVADLRLPEGVRTLAEPTQALVTVSPPMAEEVAAPAAPVAAEPEVVTERKPEAEEEE
ncbi:MAG: 50S ribosomal protein L25 [Candidatus Rokubacteria bacterium]|nr:50S ribosomal protein L25 [Candidatus Rokubacteria bacterium]MBI2878925.1 50S ribosomal protein L25 [Candidatus Rokubacteria bacterium]